MIGLLETVYGRIEVVEVLLFIGTGNTREMSSGVSMATLQNQSGMVITIFGAYLRQHLVNNIEYI